MKELVLNLGFLMYLHIVRIKKKYLKSSDKEDDDDEANIGKEEDDDDQEDDDNTDHDDDSERTDSDNDGDDFVHPKFSTHDDEARQEEEEVNEEESFDLIVQTPSQVKSINDEDNDDDSHACKQSLIQTHSSHASGSGAHEGTGVKPGVLDVPTYRSDKEEISWKSSDKEDDDDEANIAFVMNRLKVDTLAPKLLAGLTYEMMKGSCKSLAELEFFLEEVYKATTDQLDCNNPEGQQYPHDLRKPLPLIPTSQGCRVIPFDHFINNDLEYLCGGGISHWGRKRQQFYGFAVNRESARDVYSKRRIIAATELQIVEWNNYKHLD
nr:hypothetical protein [Tanacetum cinerariifolium]